MPLNSNATKTTQNLIYNESSLSSLTTKECNQCFTFILITLETESENDCETAKHLRVNC